MAIKQAKWSYLKYANTSIARSTKIYPNWDFWFENIPSGNPALKAWKNLCLKASHDKW
jgi:hypothetical protein